MIIPVRCFTCNKVIGDKWEKYQELMKHSYSQTDEVESNDSNSKVLLHNLKNKTKQAVILDKLGLKDIVARRHVLAHIDLIDEI